jgi:antitoxin MazE
MRVQTKVQKWGNGLAIRIAGVMRDIPHFQDGTPIEVEITESGLLIKKLKKAKTFKFPYSEQELLANMTEKNSHADLLAKPLDGEF